VILDRTVRRIEPTASKTQEDGPLRLSAYDDATNIVLLGDPGAGKTHTFREMAIQCGGRFVTARRFLVEPAAKFAGTLFIDGLDEKRGGRSDRDTVDAVVEKLFAVAPSKVRVSCRVGDWLGDTDLAALAPYFELGGDPVVLLLGRLANDEQRVVLQAQGLSSSDADAFLSEATERALTDFLENPQNLIMLQRAVQSGQWPATRKELFELSTQLMLKEFDRNHARSGSGIYTVEELRPAAGAICAARLISDVEAISLADQEGSPEIPSYRSLSMVAPEKTIAALGRRVFVAGPVPESIDYAHRTTAEYLGAACLADVVRSGIPLGRLQALMGIDGYPAPELRGLNAWLAVHLPEHAERLIDADPYGVLTYGDAASLFSSSCAHLVKALGRLSQTNPWFRSGNWQSPAIAALSRTDMVTEFQAVLRSNSAGFGVRAIVVEAAAYGAPRPELKDDLAEVVVRSQSPYAERVYALIALLRIGAEGKAAAKRAFHKLGADTNALRLRAEIIERMYGESFGPADIVVLLKDVAGNADDFTVTAFLHDLSENMPLDGIPAVLENLPYGESGRRPLRSKEHEVARFVDRTLVRAWREIDKIDPVHALRWLRLRNSYSSGYGGARSDGLRSALIERKECLKAITDYFLDTFEIDDNRWLRLSRFREITLLTVTSEELFTHIMTHMTRAETGGEKELFFYEAAFSMSYQMEGPNAQAAFEALFALADNRADLQAVRNRSTVYELGTGYLDRSPRDKTEESPEKLRDEFQKAAETIRDGSNLPWLTWAACLYFGLFSDSNQQASPRERIVTLFGETNAQIAIEGFIAALSRPDVPSLGSVVELTANGQVYNWWYALAAGLIEGWKANLGRPISFNDDFLKGMLVFNLTNPVFEWREGGSHVVVPEWKAALMQERPELAHDAYVAIARAKLAGGQQNVDGLRELMVDDAFKLFRGNTALQFLRDFPNMDRFRLNELIDGVLATPAVHSEFLDISQRVLTGMVEVEEQQYDTWLAAAYRLSPHGYEARVDAIARQRPSIVFELRDRSGFGSHGEPSGTLALAQLEFLARLTGTHYPATSPPSGGWWGNTNTWDAVEFCRKLITAISAIPSEAASEALKRLESGAGMASYNLELRQALANHESRRRETEYDRPDWPSTIKTLTNGAPATVADLHALLLDQLDDLRARITHENTDIYKSFWNVDSHSRPQAPRPEDACRDTLVTMLRPALAPKGIAVEPEGHMVADKRADISVAMPGRKILCELKRDYHDNLWTAADEQLERFYAHDPEAKGFGVYGVFWFGAKRPSQLPKHPNELDLPKSAAQMEQMLKERVPANRRSRIAVIVIDVTGPFGAAPSE
jgi:hypothetical protein